MIVWNDHFGDLITPDVRWCDECHSSMDEGEEAYFDGFDYLCESCAEKQCRGEAEKDAVQAVQEMFHELESRRMTYGDMETLYLYIENVMEEVEEKTENKMKEMRVILDEYGNGHAA